MSIPAPAPGFDSDSSQDPPGDINTAEIAAMMQRMAMELDYLRSENEALSVAMFQAGLLKKVGPEQFKNVTDRLWQCSCCGQTLALYNLEQDLVKWRYRDAYLHVRVGDGGFIRTLCRRCGELNEEKFVARRDGSSPAGAASR